MRSELQQRVISGVILGAIVLLFTWWSFWSFTLICLIGSVILVKEWWALTKHRSKWWIAFGILYLGGAIISLLFWRMVSDSVNVILVLYALVWGGDIAAYVVGKKFGKHKIAPSISPGKSWEGLAASFVICASIGVYAALHNTHPLDWQMAIILGPVAGSYAIVGLAGDMFESYLKRKAGAKDSGTLIPGHGGLFDRVDALLACAIYSSFLGLAFTAYAVAGVGFVK